METADIVKGAVSAAPYSIDKPYDYLVPEALAESAAPGVRVMVPFGRGNRESEGLILTRSSGPKLPGIKALRSVLDAAPVLDRAGIDLALWMRSRYFCTMFEAVRTILPAGLWYGVRPAAWRIGFFLFPLQSPFALVRQVSQEKGKKAIHQSQQRMPHKQSKLD